jgi:hypothetical protein
MAKRAINYGVNTKKQSKPKCTSIGNGFISKTMMNKSKRRSYKPYRGQGRR